MSITLDEISNFGRDEDYDEFDNFSIDNHEMGCHYHDSVNYVGDETDENIIRLWFLAFVVAKQDELHHKRVFCYIYDEFDDAFDENNELLADAWKLAVDKGLTYSAFGDAIRQLGWIANI